MPSQVNGVKKETKKTAKKKQSNDAKIAEAITLLLDRIDTLEARLSKVEGRMGL
tara:strand:+ start:84 stop:245 length:162 start_codon:yes stop_codon:yes gene_type:complete